jgi:hypothetical protein
VQAGDLYTPHIDVTGGDPTTTATLAMLDADDNASTLPVTGDGTGLTFDGPQVPLTAGGEWRFTWTVRKPGAADLVHTDVLLVDPDPAAIPAGFSYATTGDLARYTMTAVPVDARTRLINASREIDRITKSALYATGPDGKAVDPGIRRALADATCELIGWWDSTGTETGDRSLFTSASIAGVSLGFGGSGASNPQADRVGPRVWTILLGAGLVGTTAVGVYG